jgi:hypothetical protein
MLSRPGALIGRKLKCQCHILIEENHPTNRNNKKDCMTFGAGGEELVETTVLQSYSWTLIADV